MRAGSTESTEAGTNKPANPDYFRSWPFFTARDSAAALAPLPAAVEPMPDAEPILLPMRRLLPSGVTTGRPAVSGNGRTQR